MGSIGKLCVIYIGNLKTHPHICSLMLGQGFFSVFERSFYAPSLEFRSSPGPNEKSHKRQSQKISANPESPRGLGLLMT